MRAVSRLRDIPRLMETMRRSVKLLLNRHDDRAVAVSVLIERGLIEPIRVRHAEVQINLANILKVRMGLIRHLYALRAVCFMGREGDLLQRFLNATFELGSDSIRNERRVEVELTNVLSSCLESCGEDEFLLQSEHDISRHANRFSVRLLPEKKDEEKRSEYAVASSKVTKDTQQQISRLSLEYEAGWLVQRVITRDCMKEYNTIFRLLLEVKRVKYSVVRAHILYMKVGRQRSNKLYERASHHSSLSKYARIHTHTHTHTHTHKTDTNEHLVGNVRAVRNMSNTHFILTWQRSYMLWVCWSCIS